MDVQSPDQSGIIILWDGEILNSKFQAKCIIFFLKNQTGWRDDHTLCPIECGIPEMTLKGFVIIDGWVMCYFKKCPESLAGNQIVRPVGRQKFHDGVLLILNSHTAKALSPINIEYPHRNSVFSGNSREKA